MPENACREMRVVTAPSSRATAAESPAAEPAGTRRTLDVHLELERLGSIRGSDGKVFDDEIASAPPRNVASASSTMFAVAGVSFTHTGTLRRLPCTTLDHRVDRLQLSLPRWSHVLAIHVRTREIELSASTP